MLFGQFYLSTKNGFKNIPKEYIEVASNNGASQWQLLRYVLLPLSTEHIKPAFTSDGLEDGEG